MDCIDRCHKKPYVIVANHDRINEKNPAHSLEFLRNISHLVVNTTKITIENKDLYLIPYNHDLQALRQGLKELPIGSLLIMHQGLNGTNSGEYIQDKTALSFEDVADFRVISGHYHTRQDIKTGRPRQDSVGVFSYVGNPYTLNFGEAKDPAKGFQVLMDDGSLKFVPTNLRRHIVHECQANNPLSMAAFPINHISKDDLIKIKVSGTREQLMTLTKQEVANRCGLYEDYAFKLELIPTDAETTTVNVDNSVENDALLDQLIDSLKETSEERKTRLKELWRQVTCN